MTGIFTWFQYIKIFSNKHKQRIKNKIYFLLSIYFEFFIITIYLTV